MAERRGSKKKHKPTGREVAAITDEHPRAVRCVLDITQGWTKRTPLSFEIDYPDTEEALIAVENLVTDIVKGDSSHFPSGLEGVASLLAIPFWSINVKPSGSGLLTLELKPEFTTTLH